MPANIITINGVSKFNVVDSRMEAFLEYLAIVAYPENKGAKKLIKPYKVK